MISLHFQSSLYNYFLFFMARYLYKDSIVIILQYITGISIQSEYVAYSIPHSVNDIKFNLNYNTGELSIRSQNEIQRAPACAPGEVAAMVSTLQLARRRALRTKPSIAIGGRPSTACGVRARCRRRTCGRRRRRRTAAAAAPAPS